MEVAANALGLADICIRYGVMLVRVCKSYNSADQTIREAILKIEGHWFKIQHQLEFLRKIWSSLNGDYQIHQNMVLQTLQSKVKAATTLVDGVINKPGEASTGSTTSKREKARHVKYALWVKDSLDSVLMDLKHWSEVFDMSWFLIIRESNALIDQELNSVQSFDDSCQKLGC